MARYSAFWEPTKTVSGLTGLIFCRGSSGE